MQELGSRCEVVRLCGCLPHLPRAQFGSPGIPGGEAQLAVPLHHSLQACNETFLLVTRIPGGQCVIACAADIHPFHPTICGTISVRLRAVISWCGLGGFMCTSRLEVCALNLRPEARLQAILKIATEEHAKRFVPVSIAQYSVYEALAADLLARLSLFLQISFYMLSPCGYSADCCHESLSLTSATALPL